MEARCLGDNMLGFGTAMIYNWFALIQIFLQGCPIKDNLGPIRDNLGWSGLILENGPLVPYII